eukprot:scaffold7257_cov65-Phaeocystis_antarctica.AAC.1
MPNAECGKPVSPFRGSGVGWGQNEPRNSRYKAVFLLALAHTVPQPALCDRGRRTKTGGALPGIPGPKAVHSAPPVPCDVHDVAGPPEK